MKGLLLIGAALLRAAGLVAAIAVVVFLLLGAVPGDVVDVMAVQGDLTPAQQAALRAEMGLDASLPRQFAHWAGALAAGDLGRSLRFGRPVAAMVETALPVTLSFAAMAFALGLALALALAVGAAMLPRSVLPGFVEAINLWSIAMPTFVAGLGAILFFSIWLGWLPVIGNVPVPVVILGLDITGQLAKPLLEELREAMAAPHVRTARAKGLHPLRIAALHVLPAALPVLLALSSVALAGLIGGTMTMEALFGLPGLGSLALNAVHGRDLPVVQAVVLVLAVGVVAINAAADTLRRLADPRVKA